MQLNRIQKKNINQPQSFQVFVSAIQLLLFFLRYSVFEFIDETVNDKLMQNAIKYIEIKQNDV